MGVEGLVVVGAVVDADAVVVDLLPFDGHQLDVVLAPQRHRDVSAHGDQRRPHLVRRQRAAGHHRVSQAVVLALLPPADDPLLQQVVQLGERPYRLAFGVPAALAGVGTRVAGHVLGEQRVDRGERALHLPFGRPVARRRRLQGNAQRRAGGDERGRDEHPALVDHDGLRGDDRPRCGSFQTGVHAQQPLVGDHGTFHRQRLGPGRPHRRGDHHLRQQLRRVHAAGSLRAQHGRADAAGRHIQRDGQLGPLHHPVVEYHEGIQQGAVHHHQFTRRHHRRRDERGSRARRAPAALPRAAQQPAPVGQGVHEPVERRR